MPRFPGVDYFLVDSLFSEQELLVRQTARQFVEDRAMPLVKDCFREGRFPKELIPEFGQLGFLGANLDGYGCAGMNNVEYGLIMQEIERGGLWAAQLRVGAGRVGDVPDLHLRQRGAEAALAAEAAIGRGHRMLRPYRAGLRLQPRRDADQGQAGRRSLGLERGENLDHQCDGGRRGGGLGEGG